MHPWLPTYPPRFFFPSAEYELGHDERRSAKREWTHCTPSAEPGEIFFFDLIMHGADIYTSHCAGRKSWSIYCCVRAIWLRWYIIAPDRRLVALCESIAADEWRMIIRDAWWVDCREDCSREIYDGKWCGYVWVLRIRLSGEMLADVVWAQMHCNAVDYHAFIYCQVFSRGLFFAEENRHEQCVILTSVEHEPRENLKNCMPESCIG